MLSPGMGVLCFLLCISLPAYVTAQDVSGDALTTQQHSTYQLIIGQRQKGDLNTAKATAIRLLEEARQDDNPVAMAIAYEQLGQILDEQNLYEQAFLAYNNALAQYTQLQQLPQLTRVLASIGENYRYRGRYQQAFDYLRRAKDLYISLDDDVGMARQTMAIGLVYKAVGQYDNALQSLRDALDILRENGQVGAISRCLSHIGDIYMEIGDDESALVILNDALAINQQAAFTAQTAKTNRKLGELYLQMQRYSEAKSHLEKAISQFSRLDATLDKEQANVVLARLELATGDADAGLNRLNQALINVRKTGEPPLVTHIHLAIAQSYLSLNDPDTAISHARAGLTQASDRQELGVQLQLLSVLVDAFKQRGQYALALYALEQRVAVQREIETSNHAMSLQDIQTEIELSRQATSIEMLKKDRAISLAKARERNLQTSMLLGGAIAFLLVLFLLWSRFKERQLTITLQREVNRRTLELKTKNEELEQAYHSLEKASLRDPLTGLFNRHYLESQLPGEIKRCQHTYALDKDHAGDADLLCFLIDIDHFKAINDTYGHLAGDRFLVQFADIIRGVFRQHDLMIRWGGEEFLVICRHGQRGTMQTLARRLLSEVRACTFDLGDNRHCKATCSIGLAPLPLDRHYPFEHDWNAVFSVIDFCLYAAKSSGRDNYVGLTDIDTQGEAIGANTRLSAMLKRQAMVVTSLNNLAGIHWPDEDSNNKTQGETHV
ncbi:tetratricopeptide repeat-containing diguanylate cyclase [Alteromonas sp. CYL-A6]|uniref:tetratricopeptide repeat-containing diguanylate cyclase n=1 Tax=Alteromonas nitratireducens TaxID=3390813 RepID=UPI0034AA84BC